MHHVPTSSPRSSCLPCPHCPHSPRSHPPPTCPQANVWGYGLIGCVKELINMGHLFFAATSACQPNVLALAKACTGGYVDGTNDLHTTYKVPSLDVTTFNENIDSGELDPTLLPSILLHPAPCTLYRTYTLHLPCLGLGPLWGGRASTRHLLRSSQLSSACSSPPLAPPPCAPPLHLHVLHLHHPSNAPPVHVHH